MRLSDKICPYGGHIPGPGCVICEKRAFCPLALGEYIPPDEKLFFVTGNLSLPRRRRESHKGDYGRLLIFGGSPGYTGAPTLCARAAVRAGAGLVSLGVPEPIYAITAVKNDEVMPFALGPGPDSGEKTRILSRLETADVTAAGPGMGRSEYTQALVRLLLEHCKAPLLLDADALWALSFMPEALQNSAAKIVLTPHEGEFNRLWPARSGNRLEDARAFAAKSGCCLVLKGHRTLVAFPDGRVYVVAAGNPGMATGGSGDVLSGVIAAMLGQLDFERAVVTGCWLHARAGDLAAADKGEYGLIASDIIEYLPRAETEIQTAD